MAIFIAGCCKTAEKAQEIVESAKEIGETAVQLAEDFEKLQDEDGNFELTQDRLDKFFKYYPIFIETITEKGEKVEAMEDDFYKSMMGIQEFTKFDKSLRKAGIDNPAELYLTVSEVSTAFFYLSAEKHIGFAKEQISESMSLVKEQLENPDLPEEQKKALREAIAEMGSNPEALEVELPDNLTEKELELVKTNFAKIAESLGIEQEDANALTAEQVDASEPQTPEDNGE
jgi:hypothetical protein